MWNAELDEAQLESRLLEEISIILDMQMTPPLWQHSEEELKSTLMKVKEESEKAGLRLSVQRVHLWRIHVDVWQNQYSIVK